MISPRLLLPVSDRPFDQFLYLQGFGHKYFVFREQMLRVLLFYGFAKFVWELSSVK
jgi:hypothetical protein